MDQPTLDRAYLAWLAWFAQQDQSFRRWCDRQPDSYTETLRLAFVAGFEQGQKIQEAELQRN
jgi:hypothetical protein